MMRKMLWMLFSIVARVVQKGSFSVVKISDIPFGFGKNRQIARQQTRACRTVSEVAICQRLYTTTDSDIGAKTYIVVRVEINGEMALL